LPNFKFDTPKPIQQQLTIELVKPAPEPVAIPDTPEPPEPEPVNPVPIQPRPKQVVQKIQKSPDPAPAPETVPERPTEPSPPPEVMAISPTKTEAKPTVTVPPPPPPEPIKPSGPSEGDIDAARNAYRNKVQIELKKCQRYPKIAEMRGAEGDVKLEISIDRDGNVTHVAIAESSNNPALDKAAESAVACANIKQHMTDILRGHVDKITVTVGFKLAN
jgi:protein TonB